MQLTPFLSVWESPVSEARAVLSLLVAVATATPLLRVHLNPQEIQCRILSWLKSHRWLAATLLESPPFRPFLSFQKVLSDDAE